MRVTRLHSGRRDRDSRGERGLLSTELALIMPVMFVFALLAIFVIQVERHESRAQQAADVAARAASLERNEGDAQAAALAAAARVCEGSATIESFSFSEPVTVNFEPGLVTLTISCTENFSAFGALTSDTNRTEQAQAVAVIEYWRSN